MVSVVSTKATQAAAEPTADMTIKLTQSTSRMRRSNAEIADTNHTGLEPFFSIMNPKKNGRANKMVKYQKIGRKRLRPCGQRFFTARIRHSPLPARRSARFS